MKIINFLKGKKTAIIAILTLIYAWLGFALKLNTLDVAMQLTSVALIGLGLKFAIIGK